MPCGVILRKQEWLHCRRQRDLGRELNLVWVPGHCGLVGNEMADAMARRGAEGDQDRVVLDEDTS